MRYEFIQWHVEYPGPRHNPEYHLTFKLPHHRKRDHVVGITSASMNRFCRVVNDLYPLEIHVGEQASDRSSITYVQEVKP